MKMPVFASTLLAVTGVFVLMYTLPVPLADGWLRVIRRTLFFLSKSSWQSRSF
jgi:hypothetical protein